MAMASAHQGGCSPSSGADTGQSEAGGWWCEWIQVRVDFVFLKLINSVSSSENGDREASGSGEERQHEIILQDRGRVTRRGR